MTRTTEALLNAPDWVVGLLVGASGATVLAMGMYVRTGLVLLPFIMFVVTTLVVGGLFVALLPTARRRAERASGDD
ncbi:MAG: hypothetical protein GY788_32900 [bacterium]|nr:hypothetical protein [bacterium]